MTAWTSFADDPIDGTSTVPDLLERDRYAVHLAALLNRVRRQTAGNSATLALIGPWGGGKSSVLNLVKAHLDRAEWSVAEFNPWAYHDLDSMLQGFFQEIRAALPKDTQERKARRAVGRFIDTYAWLGKVGSVAGADVESALKGFGDLLQGDTSLSAQHEEVAAALRATGQPVLVLLDDLDRLAPAELLLVFKLVRFVGRLPYIYYVLSYDEQTLLDVITRTDLCADDPRRARDYLEKIIQIRLDLPPLRHAQAAQLFRQGIESVADALDDVDNARLAEAYEGHIGERLTTPRAINRYVIQLDALYPLVANEVDFADFAVISFIRTFEPRLYAMLARLKGALATSTGRLPEYMDKNDYRPQWIKLVRDGGVADADADGIVRLLALLFPVVAGAVSNPAGADETTSTGGIPFELVKEAANRKGIGHADYFDRYFAFATSVDRDLSDAEVGRFLEAMTTGDADAADVARLEAWLADNTPRAIRKLMARRVPTPEGTETLLRFLAHTFGALSDEEVGFENQRRTVERAAAELLKGDADRWADRVRALAADERASMLLTARLIHSRTDLTADLRSTISGRIRRDLEPRTTEPFWNATPDDRNLLYVWRLIDQEALRSFLRYTGARAAWDLADVVSWIIAGERANKDGTLSYGWHRQKAADLDGYIGLQYIYAELAPRIAAAKTDHVTADADTPVARREAALQVLSIVQAKNLLAPATPTDS